MRKIKYWVLGLAAAVSLFVSACGQTTAAGTAEAVKQTTETATKETDQSVTVETVQTPKAAAAQIKSSSGTFDLSAIPAYSGQPYIAVNDNVPFFSQSDLTDVSFEGYGDLDALGRCSTAFANVGTDTMPTEKRGNIGQVKPTGWHTTKYDFVDGKYLYNRCHLIGYQLTAENANEKNLITGTRYLNVQGMLPFENLTADYVKETGNHVLYRVTPIFEGDNLLASGVLMEAESVEDDGDGVLFCVYVYNVQPGVAIDYATGDNWLAEDGGAGSAAAAGSGNSSASENGANTSSGGKNTSAGSSGSTVSKTSDSESGTYILNTKTMKFHRPDCTSVEKIKAENKEEYTGKRSKLIEEGYEACKSCKP